MHDWALSRRIRAALACPTILAGGLRPGNVGQAIRAVGSHFAAQANWRRQGRAVIGTMSVDVPDDRAALMIVPPAMRADARIHATQALAA